MFSSWYQSCGKDPAMAEGTRALAASRMIAERLDKTLQVLETNYEKMNQQFEQLLESLKEFRVREEAAEQAVSVEDLVRNSTTDHNKVATVEDDSSEITSEFQVFAQGLIESTIPTEPDTTAAAASGVERNDYTEIFPCDFEDDFSASNEFRFLSTPGDQHRMPKPSLSSATNESNCSVYSETTTSATTVGDESSEATVVEEFTSKQDLVASEDLLNLCAKDRVADFTGESVIAAEAEVEARQVFVKCLNEPAGREIEDAQTTAATASEHLQLMASTFLCKLTNSLEGEKCEPEVFKLASEVMPRHFRMQLLPVLLSKGRQSRKNWVVVATGFKGGTAKATRKFSMLGISPKAPSSLLTTRNI